MKNNSLLYLILLVFIVSCKELPGDFIKDEKEIPCEVLKWPDGKSGAIILTFDSGGLDSPRELYIQQFAEKYNIPLNYELVTSGALGNAKLVEYFKNSLLKRGHGFYGHGHWHYNHDALSYNDAYDSFKRCYDFFDSVGIPVISYSYPGGFGYNSSTTRALKDAGFFAGRLYDQTDQDNPYILSGNQDEPDSWYKLPTIVMQAYEYDACEACINNTEELIPFLTNTEKKTAMIILTYHAVGDKGNYGFYQLEDFEKDIMAIAKTNLWKARFNDAVKYIYERKYSEVVCKQNYNIEDKPISIFISVNTNLNKNIFNYPLSISANIPSEWINRKLKISGSGKTIDTLVFKNKKGVFNLAPSENHYVIDPL